MREVFGKSYRYGSFIEKYNIDIDKCIGTYKECVRKFPILGIFHTSSKWLYSDCIKIKPSLDPSLMKDAFEFRQVYMKGLKGLTFPLLINFKSSPVLDQFEKDFYKFVSDLDKLLLDNPEPTIYFERDARVEGKLSDSLIIRNALDFQHHVARLTEVQLEKFPIWSADYKLLLPFSFNLWLEGIDSDNNWSFKKYPNFFRTYTLSEGRK